MTPLVALVVAHRGGAALARTLASVDWAARRYVIDPGNGLSPADWPSNVERWTASGVVGWVLLLSEGEIAADGLRAALQSAEGSAAAHRIVLECHAFGGSLRSRRPPVRLSRSSVRDVHVSLGGEIEFAVNEAAPLLSGATIVYDLPPLPADAVDALNAEARTMAALAAARGCRPRFTRLVASGMAAAAGLLFGRGRGRLGWGRWIAAVLAGYRALLAEAKLWERTQLGA